MELFLDVITVVGVVLFATALGVFVGTALYKVYSDVRNRFFK